MTIHLAKTKSLHSALILQMLHQSLIQHSLANSSELIQYKHELECAYTQTYFQHSLSSELIMKYYHNILPTVYAQLLLFETQHFYLVLVYTDMYTQIVPKTRTYSHSQANYDRQGGLTMDVYACKTSLAGIVLHKHGVALR